MPEKTIDTLVEDIYGLFKTPSDLEKHIADEVARGISETLTHRLKTDGEERKFTLRMSNLGKPDRQLWYEAHRPTLREDLPPNTYIKFLFGDVWEAIILGLAEAAGHKVELKQAEVELDGILGHIDCVIDGVLVDVKSASPFSFTKFSKRQLEEDDPFGYMEQMSGYAEALGGLNGAFLVVEKVLGKIVLVQYDYEESLKPTRIRERIAHLKGVIADADNIPDRCHPTVPDGKSGNEALNVNCSYCAFKKDCWADANDGIGLRTFIYANGPKFLTTVVREPNVPEATF